jgi:hypothetical protein
VIATETYQGKAPARVDEERRCYRGDKCATKTFCGEVGKVNRYATPHEFAIRPPVSILLCESCERERRSLCLDALELIRYDKNPPKKPVAKKGVDLPGLLDARVAAGYSGTALGALVGCSGQHIYNIEGKNKGAGEELVKKLARALGVEVRELRGL